MEGRVEGKGKDGRKAEREMSEREGIGKAIGRGKEKETREKRIRKGEDGKGNCEGAEFCERYTG